MSVCEREREGAQHFYIRFRFGGYPSRFRWRPTKQMPWIIIIHKKNGFSGLNSLLIDCRFRLYFAVAINNDNAARHHFIQWNTQNSNYLTDGAPPSRERWQRCGIGVIGVVTTNFFLCTWRFMVSRKMRRKKLLFLLVFVASVVCRGHSVGCRPRILTHRQYKRQILLWQNDTNRNSIKNYHFWCGRSGWQSRGWDVSFWRNDS